jgi:hypothetical protein
MLNAASVWSSPLADECNRDEVERHEGVELMMVAGHDLAGEFLGEHDAEAVGKRDASQCLCAVGSLWRRMKS